MSDPDDDINRMMALIGGAVLLTVLIIGLVIAVAVIAAVVGNR